jgi:hypothetical protein
VKSRIISIPPSDQWPDGIENNLPSAITNNSPTAITYQLPAKQSLYKHVFTPLCSFPFQFSVSLSFYPFSATTYSFILSLPIFYIFNFSLPSPSFFNPVILLLSPSQLLTLPLPPPLL